MFDEYFFMLSWVINGWSKIPEKYNGNITGSRLQKYFALDSIANDYIPNPTWSLIIYIYITLLAERWRGFLIWSFSFGLKKQEMSNLLKYVKHYKTQPYTWQCDPVSWILKSKAKKFSLTRVQILFVIVNIGCNN